MQLTFTNKLTCINCKITSYLKGEVCPADTQCYFNVESTVCLLDLLQNNYEILIHIANTVGGPGGSVVTVIDSDHKPNHYITDRDRDMPS